MNWPILSADDVRTRVARLPRVPLAHLPTPLDEVSRFARQIGDVRMFMKRDDCTGLLLGGNKARHNEFLMGDALAQGCDLVVWGAGAQSNNCRQTAASCAKLGLECRLYLSRGAWNTAMTGNLLLDHLVGAHVELVDAEMGPELDALMAGKKREFESQGRTVYVSDKPRVVPLAAIGYVLCVLEIAEQLGGRMPDAIYVSSSGSTGAGLILGAKLLGWTCPVRCIGYHRWPWSVPEELARVAGVAAGHLGVDATMSSDEIEFDGGQIGPGYGKITHEGAAATKLLATTEGILLDPVYGAKAMAALIADVKCGRIAAGATVVFVHTGGTPVVFAYGEEMLTS